MPGGNVEWPQNQDWIQDAIQKWVKKGNEIADGIKEIPDKVQQKVENIVQNVEIFSGRVVDAVSSSYRAVKSNLWEFWDKTKTVTQNTYNSVRDLYQEGKENIINTTQQVVERVEKTLENAKNAVAEELQELWEWAKALAQGIKEWAIKNVEFIAEQWVLLYEYAGREWRVNVQRFNQIVNKAERFVQEKKVQTVNILNDGWVEMKKGWKLVMKTTVQVAATAGILLYRWWKYVVDTSKLAIDATINKVEEIATTISEVVKEKKDALYVWGKDKVVKAIEISKEWYLVVKNIAKEQISITIEDAIAAGVIIKRAWWYIVREWIVNPATQLGNNISTLTDKAYNYVERKTEQAGDYIAEKRDDVAQWVANTLYSAWDFFNTTWGRSYSYPIPAYTQKIPQSEQLAR